MGFGFCLVSNNNDENMSKELANINLTANWRECGGIGCYSLLQMLVGYSPTFCYEMEIELETIKEMYYCVNYFIDNKSVCDEVDFPNWCKKSHEYEYNRNIKMEINENTLNQAKLLLQWFKIGINNNCIISIF